MDLYLIRHGESTNNRGDLPRVADPPLTDLGWEQARRAGEALEEEGITCLYCSPMLRALQTATAIGAVLDLPPRVFVGLHEWGGMWEERDGASVQLPGMTRREMLEVCSRVILPDDVTDAGWWFHEWESDEEMILQTHGNMAAFLRYLRSLELEPEARVAVVAHGGSGGSLINVTFDLAPACGPDGRYYERFSQHNCAVSKLLLTPERVKLRFLNRVDHLSEEMLT